MVMDHDCEKLDHKKDFYYTINGEKYVIPAGFTFDGASVPKFLASFLSPVGVLLIGGLIHDYGYKYKTLLKADKNPLAVTKTKNGWTRHSEISISK